MKKINWISFFSKNNSLKITLFILMSFLHIQLIAQQPQFEWARSVGGSEVSNYTSTDVSHAVTTDTDGNIYTTGEFIGVADFDPGPDSMILDSEGFRHIFIQKLDADGNLLWAVSIGSSATQGYTEFDGAGLDIVTDEQGNVYVTGYFALIADFDPGPGIANMNGGSGSDIFILKLDTNGNYIWSKSIGNSHIDWGRGIAVDISGNVYVTGSFRTTVDFDPGPGTAYLTATDLYQALDDAFILKLDTDGNYQWALSLGESSYDIGTGITTDSAGNVYIAGYHTFDVDFNPGTGTFYTGRDEGAFVQKLDTGGNFIWAASFGDQRVAYAGPDVALDDSNNVYLTGPFSGTQDFDPGPGFTTLTSGAYVNAFTVKLDEEGQFIWAKSINSNTVNQAYGISVDKQNSVYTIGTFSETVDCDPGTSTFLVTPTYGQNTFIQKLDRNGNFVWAGAMGGKGRDIHIDSSCNVLVTGDYSITTDFDPNEGVFNLTENGTTEIYVVKLNEDCTSAICPPGGITFKNQQEIDDFPTNYPGCTTIAGNIYIDAIGANDDINNLNGLNQLVNIEGNLTFHFVNGITDLSGLENLSTIGGSLSFDTNHSLTSLAGLESLNSIGGNLSFYSNNQLASPTGLNNLTSIGGRLYVESGALSSLEGLYNLASIGGNLELFGGFSLTDISSLQALTSVGGNLIIWSTYLSSLNGLENLGFIGGTLDLESNHNLIDISALQGISTLGGALKISSHPLVNLTGLENLNSIGGELNIRSNVMLTDITALSNLTAIGGKLSINYNDALDNLTGLDNINPNTITELIITYNNILSYCGVTSICDYLAMGGTYTIDNNATGCNDNSSILQVCFPSDCPQGDIVLDSQQQIDDFAATYPGCTEIPGNLTLENATDLSGLSQLTTITGELRLENNTLSNLNGLHNINSIGTHVLIIRNNIDNFSGLNITTTTGNLSMAYNTVASFSGSNISEVGGDLRLSQNICENFSGLESLTTVGGELFIGNHHLLTEFTGLENLASVGTNIILHNNTKLSTFSPLSGISSMNGTLSLISNTTLTNLIGLENINSDGIQYLVVGTNPNLSICSVPNICTYLENGGTHNIIGNTTGCNTLTEILYSCSNTNLLCPTGDITLTLQQQIDDFANIANCNSIPGRLIIRGDTPGSITNLNGLSQLTSIEGGLVIDSNNWLTSLNGLENLTTTGYDLIISNNKNLTSLEGLENITSTASHLKIENNDALTNLVGLEGITSVGGNLFVIGNLLLQNLSGLENFATIDEQLSIISNNSLKDLIGLENLTSVGTNIELHSNRNLTSISSLSNLSSMSGTLSIISNDLLESLTGVENIDPNSISNLIVANNINLTTCNQTSICTYLENGGTANITNNLIGCNTQAEIEAACMPVVCPQGNIILDQQEIDNFATKYPGCTVIDGNLLIDGDITNLNGLNQIESITGYLEINYLDITNLTGLSSLTSIGGDLSIGFTELTSLNGLESLTSIGGNLFIDFNNALNNIKGLENLSFVGGDISLSNLGITSLEGLEKLTTINGDFNISNNSNLNNLNGLENITSIDGFLEINIAPNLTSIAGLQSLNSIGEYFYINITKLADLSGLENLSTIGGDLIIRFNEYLNNLSAIENLDHTTLMDLIIRDNYNLSTCSITSICNYLAAGGTATIDGNALGCETQEQVETACTNTTPCGVAPVSEDITRIFDQDLFIDGIGFDNNPVVTFTDPATPADAVLSDISLELYFRLNGNTCENEIAIQITDPAGNTQPLTAYTTCDGGTGLYYVNLDVPSGNTTGSIADWIVEFDDTNDQNADYEYSVRFARLNYTTTTSGGGGVITNEVSEISDMDLFIDGVGFENNGTYTFTDPGTPADATLSDISLELYFRLNGSSCENEIALQITDPAGNTQPLTAYTTCDGGTGLYYANLNVPSGSTTGSIADWTVQFDDTNDQNSGYEYSVRFGRLTYTTTYTQGGGSGVPVTINDEVSDIADSDLFIDGVGFENNDTYTFTDPGTPADATLSNIALELYFRLAGASCENEIAIQITDPAGNTQPLTAYTTCDGGTGLYYVNLNVPSGNTTGSTADWVVEFDDTNDQNSGYEYSVRFGRLTYDTEYTECVPMLVNENTPTHEQANTAHKDYNTRTPQYHNTLKLYPVPAAQHLNVEYHSEHTRPAQFELIANDGRMLFAKEEVLQEGLNTIQLDIAELPAGHYHIRVYNADEVEMQSFIKIAP